jgi:AraC family transcriptional regulator
VNPVAKALWFIESHYTEQLTLDDVAEVCGVSRYHLSRIFGIVVGCSPIRYVRGRRLTVAARALSNGAPDILGVALEAGYSSHEAFTRAFRDQFTITPEGLRARGNLEGIQLQEPIRMEQLMLTKLEAPRFETFRALLIAGMSERYRMPDLAGIPSQWQNFAPHIGHIAGQVGSTTYGVICNTDDQGSFEYVCGVEVSDFANLPPEFAKIRVPEQMYAVFRHHDHISSIQKTFFTIFSQWLPESGYKAGEGPELEVYDNRFDPRTGNGGLDIRISIRK